VTIEEIMRKHATYGGHFFDKETLEHFNSTVFQDVFGDGYFITSERQDLDEPLRFTVRKAESDGKITSVSSFQEYETFKQACEEACKVANVSNPHERKHIPETKQETNIFSSTFDLLKAKDKRGPIGNGFDKRHNDALLHPTPKEKMLLSLVVAWVDYARTYLAEYETLIGKDSFIGPAWENIGKELHSNFLSMDMGRFDGGTLSAFMLNFAQRNGGSLDG